MKIKHYQDTASYIKRECWKKYHIRRERMLHRAAALDGWPSYQMYLHRRNRKQK